MASHLNFSVLAAQKPDSKKRHRPYLSMKEISKDLRIILKNDHNMSYYRDGGVRDDF